MQKRANRKLRLSKDTIRSLVPDDLRMVGGGLKRSCGATGCDCSGWSDPTYSGTSDTGGSGLDTIDMCGTLIPY